jgi:hypothetical protein
MESVHDRTVLHARQLKAGEQVCTVPAGTTYIHQTWSRSEVAYTVSGTLRYTMTRPTPRIFLIRHGEFTCTSASNVDNTQVKPSGL